MSTSCCLFALRNVFSILSDVDAPARKLVLYWLGTSRRILVPRALGNMYPTAEFSPPFYVKIVRQYSELMSLFPDVNVSDSPVSRLCEELCKARASSTARPPTPSCAALVQAARMLPAAQDFLWKFMWGVLPTKDKLTRWGLTPDAHCINCGARETNCHVFSECTVAKTFWCLVCHSFRFSYSRRYKITDNFLQTVILLTGLILWETRCRAVAQGRRLRMMYPMFSALRRRLTNHAL